MFYLQRVTNPLVESQLAKLDIEHGTPLPSAGNCFARTRTCPLRLNSQ